MRFLLSAVRSRKTDDESLSKIPYADTLLEYPFKGDDAPLREMEKAEIIAIVTDSSELLFLSSS